MLIINIKNGLNEMPNNFTKKVLIDFYLPKEPYFNKQSKENIEDIDEVTHPANLKELFT